MVYMVRDVPDRANILIHPGNVAGNVELGWKSNSEGCILVGAKLGILGNQRAVLASRGATRGFFRQMAEQDFILRILGCLVGSQTSSPGELPGE